MVFGPAIFACTYCSILNLYALILGYGKPGVFQSNDLAMIKLPVAFRINKKYVNPICLGLDWNGLNDWNEYPGKLKITGWGKVDANPTERKTIPLKYAEVEQIPKIECYEEEFGHTTYNNTQFHEGYFLNNSICVRHKSKNFPQVACKGDEGSPLIYEEKLTVNCRPGEKCITESSYLLGVASYVSETCERPFLSSRYLYTVNVDIKDYIERLGGLEITDCKWYNQ